MRNTAPYTPVEQKYKSKKTKIDGHTFPSRMEAKRYLQLKQLEKAGEVDKFILQPSFELQPSFKWRGETQRAITYVADFGVWYPDGTITVEDTKGMETPVFKIKKKMLHYHYPEVNLKVIH